MLCFASPLRLRNKKALALERVGDNRLSFKSRTASCKGHYYGVDEPSSTYTACTVYTTTVVKAASLDVSYCGNKDHSTGQHSFSWDG